MDKRRILKLEKMAGSWGNGINIVYEMTDGSLITGSKGNRREITPERVNDLIGTVIRVREDGFGRL